MTRLGPTQARWDLDTPLTAAPALADVATLRVNASSPTVVVAAGAGSASLILQYLSVGVANPWTVQPGALDGFVPGGLTGGSGTLL